jgi:hypothetical protein
METKEDAKQATTGDLIRYYMHNPVNPDDYKSDQNEYFCYNDTVKFGSLNGITTSEKDPFGLDVDNDIQYVCSHRSNGEGSRFAPGFRDKIRLHVWTMLSRFSQMLWLETRSTLGTS